jgi:uncharacterized protein YlzI (FlbEa/FlbD family)
MNLIEFKTSDTQADVAINPEHVVSIQADTDHPGCTNIFMGNGEVIRVDGTYQEVVRKISQSNR